MAKHYVTLKYIELDEKKAITNLQCPKKTRNWVPSIPSVGVNLVVTLSQLKTIFMEGGACAGTNISINRSSARRWCSSKWCAQRWKGVGDGYIST